MTTEQLLFWLAAFGNMILLYATIKSGFRAAMRFRMGDRTGALLNALFASALAGLTALFPWTLVAGEREIGRGALLICILTPFVFSMTKLWPSLKGRIAQAPILVADVAIVGMVTASATSGDWVWFWVAAAVLAVAWIVARKSTPRKPQMSVSQAGQLQPANDPFEEFYGPERDIANPYHIGHR